MKRMLGLLPILIWAMAATTTTAAAQDYTTGLVAKYDFENDFSDSVGTYSAGTIGLPTFVPGKVGVSAVQCTEGTAIPFTPTSYVSAGTSPIPPMAFDRTVAMWIKDAGSSGTHGLVGGSGDSTALLWSNGFLGYFDGSALTVGTTPITPGTWTHVAYVFASGQLRLYVNGALDAVGSAPLTIPGTMNLGQAPAYQAFEGALDDVRIYSRALSTVDMAALVASASAGSPTIITSTGTMSFSTTVGTPQSQALTVSNVGSAPLSVTGYAATGTGFAVGPGTSGTPCAGASFTLAVGASCTLSVTFSPSALGNHSGSVTISSNDPATATALISVSGTASAPIPTLSEWGLICMAALLAATMALSRRRNAQRGR